MNKTNYTPEIKERAVSLVFESEKDYLSICWAAVTAIAPKVGCAPETSCLVSKAFRLAESN